MTGLVAGAINSVAGSGSLVTLPALMWSGLPARDANATNRVGVLVQNVAAAVTYWRAGVMPGRLLLRLVGPNALGALAGSWVAASAGQGPMKVVIGAAMIFATLATLLYRPRKKGSPAVPDAGTGGAPAPEPPPRAHGRAGSPPPWLAYVVIAAIGFYSGLVQVGVGLVILAALPRVLDVDLVTANALKVGVVLGSQIVALTVFTLHGQVELSRAVALSAGNVLGGWLGARLAVTRGDAFVRVVVIAAALAGLLEVVLSLR